MSSMKFRAWNVETRNWCSELNIYVNGNGESIYLLGGEIEEYLSPEKVVISRFVGLVDKHGSEIHEGDICTALYKDKDGIHEVSGHIEESEYMWCLFTGANWYSINRLHEFEIIGNTFEAPELLTSDQPTGEHQTSQEASPSPRELRSE